MSWHNLLLIAISLAALPIHVCFSKDPDFHIKHGKPQANRIKQNGEIVSAASWVDAQGKNLLVISELKTTTTARNSSRSAYLYASLYLEKQGNWARQWEVKDYEIDCPFDVGVSFIPDSLSVTDLDKNGYAEVSFIYRAFCMGGLDPQTLKLIMWEKNKKYAIRGETVVVLPEQPPYGGKTVIDGAFKLAPPMFQEFAEAQWKKFQIYPRK